MCDLNHAHDHHFGFLVDVPEIRALIEETARLTSSVTDVRARVEALQPAFARLLAAEGWLPESCATPDESSRMGGGIGQYALYRAEDGSLCLFSLVVPVGASTPVHDHLAARGLVRPEAVARAWQRVIDEGDRHVPSAADRELFLAAALERFLGAAGRA